MTNEDFERPLHKNCVNYMRIQGLEKENAGLKDLMDLHNVTTTTLNTQLENLRSALTVHNNKVNDYISNAVRKEDLVDLKDKVSVLQSKVEENGAKIDELDSIFKAAKSLLTGLQWLGYITGSAVAIHQAIQYFYGQK